MKVHRAPDGAPASRATIARVLQWTTGILLFGHGALAAITAKPRPEKVLPSASRTAPIPTMIQAIHTSAQRVWP